MNNRDLTLIEVTVNNGSCPGYRLCHYYMTTKQSTVDYILDQLAALGDVSAKKMFGGYVLYCHGKVVGLVCDDKLFVKITEPGKKFVGRHYHEGHAYPGAKTSMRIDEDLIDDPSWLSELIRITAENVSSPKIKSKPSPKKTRP